MAQTPSTRSATKPGAEAVAGASEGKGTQAAGAAEGKGTQTKRGADGLTEDERRMVDQLARRDRAVRAHELAHQAAGGSLVGAASFTYQIGPDGKQYAIGGEVSVDTSAVPGNPEATIRKMQTVRAAAMAPADPSGQDMKVAASAARAEAQAKAALASEARAEAQGEERGMSRRVKAAYGGAEEASGARVAVEA